MSRSAGSTRPPKRLGESDLPDSKIPLISDLTSRPTPSSWDPVPLAGSSKFMRMSNHLNGNQTAGGHVGFRDNHVSWFDRSQFTHAYAKFLPQYPQDFDFMMPDPSGFLNP